MTEKKVTRAVGYARVSTGRQGADGLGMDAQKRMIAEEAERHGWQLVALEEDVGSGKSTNGRHGFARALQMLAAGKADALIVAKLDRLARSALDFANHLDRAKREGWALVILDLGLDTATPMGAFTAHIMAAVAELERAMISERTTLALAEAKHRGTTLGRKKGSWGTSPEVRERIVAMRQAGGSYRGIARTLTEEGIPTANGKPAWAPETVRKIHLAHIEASS